MLDFQTVSQTIQSHHAKQIVKTNAYAGTITLQGKGEIKVRVDSLSYVEVSCDSDLLDYGRVTQNYFKITRNLDEMLTLINRYL